LWICKTRNLCTEKRQAFHLEDCVLIKKIYYLWDLWNGMKTCTGDDSSGDWQNIMGQIRKLINISNVEGVSSAAWSNGLSLYFEGLWLVEFFICWWVFELLWVNSFINAFGIKSLKDVERASMLYYWCLKLLKPK